MLKDNQTIDISKREKYSLISFVYSDQQCDQDASLGALHKAFFSNN